MVGSNDDSVLQLHLHVHVHVAWTDLLLNTAFGWKIPG